MVSQKEFTDAAFNQLLGEGKLMASRCKKCGALHLPPKPICVNCQEGDMEWTILKGKGKLAAFTTIAVGLPRMIQEGYGRDNPYCSGIVELEEGPRISARILDVDARNPQKLKVGMPLVVDFLERGEGENKRTLLAFKPV